MSKLVKRVKVEDRNMDIMLEVPLERAESVKKVLDRNLSWKVINDNYELLEDIATVQNTFNPDGIRLFFYHMKQRSQPKGIVFTFHGYGASQQIDTSWSANFLASQGYEVVGFDNEGHGRNIPDEDNRCIIKDYRKLVYNGVSFIEYFLERERSRLVGVPIFLWGMSMGGGIVGNILGNDDFRSTVDKLSGAVLLAPIVEATQKPGWLAFQVMVAVSTLLPTLGFGEGAISISDYEDYLPWFKNHEDTYSKPIKIVMGREIVRLGDNFKKNAKNIRTPVLLVHGTRDNMCSFDAAVKVFKEIPSEVKTIVRVKDILHGILYERCTPDIIDITHQWLNIRVRKAREEVEGESDNEF